ncbi:hypothetical protein RI367_006410 [Sorochytrium milnesiophthora]
MASHDIEDLVSHCAVKHRHTWRSDDEVAGIRRGLLGWYDVHQRVLPWRTKHSDDLSDGELAQRAYQVWVSEIMLQQTQVATVIPYYEKWMARWPTVHDLAQADAEDVNRMWAGLGYYSRARRLHEAAQLLVKQTGGRLPREPAALEQQVPGVGKYTAGAIASIAYNYRAPLVDGNVIRVFSRLRSLGGDPKAKAVVEQHWRLAQELLDDARPGDFNQALMELGATTQIVSKPPIIKRRRVVESDSDSLSDLESSTDDDSHECKLCSTLPASASDATSGVTQYPRKPIKKDKRLQTIAVAVLVQEGADVDSKQVLIVQRPAKGLLANMWEFPNVEVEEGTDLDELSAHVQRMDATLATSNLALTDIGSLTHLFTHISTHARAKWIRVSELNSEALSTNMRKVWDFDNGTDARQPNIKSFFSPQG